MVDSRRPSSPDPGLDPAPRRAALDAVRHALHALPAGTAGIGVGLSGGPDSAALAVLSARLAADIGLAVHLFHVHHGLQAAADAWAERARDLAVRLGLPFHVERVRVEPAGDGIEAAAREARYAALARMARAAGVCHVLLAHHLDDQAETVLLRLLRGAGVDGLGAMAPSMRRDGVCYLRPCLPVARRDLLAALAADPAARGFAPVADPSNTDPALARGLLRAEVMPALARHWPGYRDTLARFARQAAEAAALLDDVAEADLAQAGRDDPAHGRALALDALAALPGVRRRLVLRAWVRGHGLPVPSEARLAQWMRQLFGAAADAQVAMRHDDAVVRRYRGMVLLDRGAREMPVPQALAWRGEAVVACPGWGGTLVFETVPAGVDPAWLSAEPLCLRGRQGGERLRTQAGRPRRSLKNLWQEAGLAAWQRSRLPLVWRGEALVFVAGLGTSADLPQARPGLALHWRGAPD